MPDLITSVAADTGLALSERSTDELIAEANSIGAPWIFRRNNSFKGNTPYWVCKIEFATMDGMNLEAMCNDGVSPRDAIIRAIEKARVIRNQFK